MRISDWSSDVCSSDLGRFPGPGARRRDRAGLNVARKASVQRLVGRNAPYPFGADIAAATVHGELAPTARAIAQHAHHAGLRAPEDRRSEEHTSELQSLMRISYAVFCLKKKKHTTNKTTQHN